MANVPPVIKVSFLLLSGIMSIFHSDFGRKLFFARLSIRFGLEEFVLRPIDFFYTTPSRLFPLQLVDGVKGKCPGSHLYDSIQ